jgi:CTP synthase
MLIVRTPRELTKDVRRKLSLFCDVPDENVVECVDVKESLYHIPLALERQNVADLVCKTLKLPQRTPDLTEWQEICDRYADPDSAVTIAMVGKYMDLQDAYLSVTEALMHGGIANSARVNIKYVDSEEVERDGAKEHLSDVSGVIVPGGFGDRGIQGKIDAIGYARENDIPYLGLCLGLQTAVIEFARNVCGLEDANSREFKEDCDNPVIVYLKEQEYVTELGGTMRLGAYPCALQEGSLAADLYEADEISERHRHRLEVNNEYREVLGENGMAFSGTSPEGDLVEMVELPDHPFFIASQFHPEFKSRPTRAHPLFRGFIGAALEHAGATPVEETEE